jgi:hypothetical protein
MVEATLRAHGDPTCMLALWLIGFEDDGPEQSGEICVCELFGNAPHARPRRPQYRGEGP